MAPFLATYLAKNTLQLEKIGLFDIKIHKFSRYLNFVLANFETFLFVF